MVILLWLSVMAGLIFFAYGIIQPDPEANTLKGRCAAAHGRIDSYSKTDPQTGEMTTTHWCTMPDGSTFQ